MHFHDCLHVISPCFSRFRGLVNPKIAFSVKTRRPESVQQPTPVRGVALEPNASGGVALALNATSPNGVGAF